jgi:hypothetical protein
MATTRFGFWPRRWRIEVAALRAEPLPNYAEIVAAITGNERVFEGWIYPPLRRASYSGRSGPEVPSKVYGLPPTHELNSSDDSPDFASFAIASIGLLDGMRLVPEGWSHFYKASIEPAKLVDFYCDQPEMTRAIDLASRWWHGADNESQKRMFGAIHWYCFTAAYEHDFERFGGLYTVLDTLYSIHELQGGTQSPRHSERAATLAMTYGIPVPPWAITHEKGCALSKLRNEFIHEGRYGGEPIGFAFPKDSITLELSAFLTRLILAMLGVECGYVHSLVTTRQMHGLDFS